LTDDRWLAAFHRGDRSIIEQCYRDHFATVDRAVARSLSGADRDGVVQDVFVDLLTKEAFRRSFQGGNLGAFLAKAATFYALSAARRLGRERTEDLDEATEVPDDHNLADRLAARQFLQRFRERRLPPKWHAVFDACFLEQRDQRSAAAHLKMARTTLAYHVLRIRWLLERFVQEGDE
jgi:RNA polymerase sigma-70 factor, ECF subfamily